MSAAATHQAQPGAPVLDDKVVATPYDSGEGFPLFIQPRDASLRSDATVALEWMRANRLALDTLLVQAGALVFRGFAVPNTTAFNAFAESYDNMRLGYTGGAASRGQLADRVYESTNMPAHAVLSLHQEMAYLPDYPKRVAFYCRVPAVTGGETILADMRRVTASLPEGFVEELGRRGVLYTRNFRDIGVPTGDPLTDQSHKPWQSAFGTTDRERAIEACKAMGMGAEWLPDGSLSATYRAPGVVSHPVTGERIWFNQVASQTLSPVSNVERWPILERHYKGKPFPYQASYGDGGPMQDDYMITLHAVLKQHAVYFPWSYGDVLLLDNYIAAHGRNRYTGLRDIQVALLN